MKARAYPTWFALGALLLYGVFTLLPSVLGIVYSFTDWNSYTTELNWVGLDNFATILSSGSNYLRFIVQHDHVHGGDDHPQDGHRPRRWRCS